MAFENIKSIEYPNREEWLKARQKGIGASDASAVMGRSKWSSRYSLWAEKCGIYRNEIEGEQLVIGGLLEPAIAKLYEIETGNECTNPGDFRIFWGEEPFQFATIDMIDSKGIIVEEKTVGGAASRDWADAPPLMYQIQCQHQMKVMQADRARLAVLFGSPYFHFKMFEVDRNERFIKLMTEAEREFWEMVKNEVAPDPDGSDATASALKSLERVSGKVVEFTPEQIEELDIRREEAKANAERYQKIQAEFENKIKLLMGDAEVALVNGTKLYSFKADKRGTRRFLRILKEEGLPV